MHSTPLRHVHCDRSVGIGQPLLAHSRWESFAIGLPRGAILRDDKRRWCPRRLPNGDFIFDLASILP